MTPLKKIEKENMGDENPPLNRPSFYFENQYKGLLIAGVDEAGCGPWAGPVAAAATILYPDHLPENILILINDSKKLSPKTRSLIADYFALEQCKNGKKAIDYAVGIARVDEIDTLNIAQATRLAMERAVNGLPALPQMVLIDGIRQPQLSMASVLIKKGDTLSLSIAAASIVAKVTRDRLMSHLHKQYPVYGWLKNAGYGTKQHQMALQQHGITPHHRKSFAPIRALI